MIGSTSLIVNEEVSCTGGPGQNGDGHCSQASVCVYIRDGVLSAS